jgi:tRNA-uridine 2-sulfurtransferase
VKVLFAMSGGVDSSVAGALLHEQGHDVVGVTMKLWGGESDTGCCSVSDVDDARRVAQQLDIDHLVFNFGEDFDRHVVGPYVAAHAGGMTPNPCVECNRHVKFDRLLRRAEQLGFDAVATGHHARVGRAPNGRFTLERGADAAKDQSYVVHMLDQAALARTLFPVGDIDKARVRELAVERRLRTASKPDSQDVCFITSRHGRRDGRRDGRPGGRETFLGNRIAFRPGRIVDGDGSGVGEVAALEMVTIGQRRGIGLPGGGPKRYVVDVDVANGLVTVGDEHDLMRASMRVERVVWTDQLELGPVRVQCSAHGATTTATIARAGDDCEAEVTWDVPQRRVAPGQSVVFYDAADRVVLGGGTAAR